MTLRRLAALAVLLPLASGLVSSGAAGQPQRPPHVVLGILRSDAVLVPFAAFDGERWSAPWPAALGGRHGGPSELPAALTDIPESWWGGEVPSEWRLWPVAGGPPRPLKPTQPILIGVGATRRFALRTDLPLQPDPSLDKSIVPYPKEGLAVAGPLPVQPIPPVSRQSPEWTRLPQRLQAEIDEAEERTIRNLRSTTGWRHPLERQARANVPASLEAWYTTPLAQPGVLVSYIEAVKKYPPAPDEEGCGLETFVSGWIQQVTPPDGRPSAGTAARAELRGVVTYCDREKASYMLPLGQFVVRDRTHWAFQMSGHDHEWYVVVEHEPGRTRHVAEYHAGGFPPAPR